MKEQHTMRLLTGERRARKLGRVNDCDRCCSVRHEGRCDVCVYNICSCICIRHYSQSFASMTHVCVHHIMSEIQGLIFVSCILR